MDRNKMSDETMSRRLLKHGIAIKASHVRNVRMGYKRPRYRIAEAIHKVTKVAVASIMNFHDQWIARRDSRKAA